MSEAEVNRILRGEHNNPFAILGAHKVQLGPIPGVVIRAFLPEADSAAVLSWTGAGRRAMHKIHPDGYFEAVFPAYSQVFPYRLELSDRQGNKWEIVDPYSFPPILSDFDLHLFNEGTYLKSYERLGAHPWKCGDIAGVLFALWAPNAGRVSVVGDFNSWDGRRHPMRSRAMSGLWELFIPGLGEGEKYKYEIRSRSGNYLVLKSDPYAFYSERRPEPASIVFDVGQYCWGDQEWMASRSNELDRPISIYEVHLSSWNLHEDDRSSFLTYKELAVELIDYVKEMGFTHIELMPVSEHPLDASWGYQTTGYFAATSRHGTPLDLQHFVDCCHQSGIGVILDWVPAHFGPDEHGLRYFDGTHLYEHEDPRLGRHLEWGTCVFNFGRNEVRNFLISNALFWLDKFHIDGLRVDAVASMLYLDYGRKPGGWIPNKYGGNQNLEAVAFIKELNTIVHGQHQNVLTIAEESTAWPNVTLPVHLGGLGFSLKWNLGWMHDTLVYFSKEPIFRKHHQNNLTFVLLYAFNENFVLPFSHDEVVHMKGSMVQKMPGDSWQKFANVRALYSLMYAFPGKKLLFMGNEFGQWNEWDHGRSLDWGLLQHEHHRKLKTCVADLNRLYRELPQLHSLDCRHEGFEWIDFSDAASSVISFVRKSNQADDFLVVVCNFTPTPRKSYRIGVPQGGSYKVIFNSDSEAYGGSNMGDGHCIRADEAGSHGRPYSLNLTLPPLGVLYLSHECETGHESGHLTF